MRWKPTLLCGLLLFAGAHTACAPRQRPQTRAFEAVRRFVAPEARQGIAVDASSFYAIDSRAIGKYDKRTGQRTQWWSAGRGSIIHLDSGTIIDGKLYCAHSNYPGVPMESSIEVFDPGTLEHLESHRLVNAIGSATWLERAGNDWWIAFANYEGRGGVPGRGPSATTLTRYDRNWKALASYSFPAEVVERFGTRSNSGGSWNGGQLYITGHDAPEIYVLQLPKTGNELELVEVLPAPIEGQGIAWDPTDRTLLYGIVKQRHEVVVMRAAPTPP